MNHGNEEISSSTRQVIPAHQPWISSRHVVRQWTMTAGVVIAYVALEWISFIHEAKGLPLTPWNPGLGLVFACLMLGGPHYGIALFAGVIIAEIVVLRSNLEWPIIIGIGAIVASGYTFVATVDTKAIPARCRTDPSSRRNHSAFSRVYRLNRDHAAPGGRSVGRRQSSSFRRYSLWLRPPSSWATSSALPSRPRLYCGSCGDGANRRSICSSARIPEFALFVVVIVIALWLIARTGTADGYTLFYLLFFPVVVGAVRHGLDGACLALATTQLGLVGLLHHHGHDWRIFTEFQVLMFVLTATGLIVGVVVSERQATERVARESEARLKEKEAEVAHAARFSLVSGMATALAHEINQPMAAARALGRSVQELLRNPQADLKRIDQNLTRLIAEIDLAGGILRRMRDFLRRGRPQISTINVPAHA